MLGVIAGLLMLTAAGTSDHHTATDYCLPRTIVIAPGVKGVTIICMFILDPHPVPSIRPIKTRP